MNDLQRALLALALAVSWASSLSAQSSAFTYQGRLAESGAPAQGLYELQFKLFDSVSGGSTSWPTLTNSADVSSGLFTSVLDFGPAAFAGDRWLEISVRTNGGKAFTTLSPRQLITPTPAALTARSADSAQSYTGPLSWSQFSAPMPPSMLPPGTVTTNAPWSSSTSSLLASVAAGSYQPVKTEFDANGIPTNSTVMWPDGTYGVWTAKDINKTWLAIDSYQITYTNSKAVITQPKVSRDHNGCATNSPALTIAQ